MSRAVEGLLAGLNSAQRRAVTAPDGPLLVLAGAGTGKTRVVTARMARLLAEGVAARNVLALTFTNKAAREMRTRVGALAGPKRAADLTVGTFHAFCARSLREHHAAAGLPRAFAIADEADQLAALRGALRELHVPEARLGARAAQARISLQKNRLVDAEAFLAAAADDEDELLGRAWIRYEERLQRSRAVDFDDLLLVTLRLLRDDARVRAAFRERWRYVLVDEYQDTNGPQYEIVLAIAGEHRNLCVVGDDDQSIYGWRGADVSKILGFERDFPGATVVRLETSYRSTDPILEAANRVIRNNPRRHEKTLRSALGDGEPVRIRATDDEQAEADQTVREIVHLHRTQSVPLGEFAILFRTSVQPRAFEVELRARGLPYVLVGGPSFFDRKEVRDVLAWLRLTANPHDEAAFLRVVQAPPRGIGKTSLERTLGFAATQGISLADAFARGGEVEGLSAGVVESAQGLLDLVRTLGAREPGRDLVPFVGRLLEAAAYKSYVEQSYPDPREARDRWAAVTDVLNMAESHVRRANAPTLAGFLEELALSADEGPGDAGERRRDAVTLMTLHAAKGLEFRRVYLVGLEEGLLPHARSVTEDTVEEERRLAYVGITRAQSTLTVSFARSRARYGQRVTSHASRFLYEMRGEPPPKGWQAWGAAEPAGPVKARTKSRAPETGKRKRSRARRAP